jgi:hypothetical protein
MRGRIPYRTVLVMSAALGSASLGAGYAAHTGMDDSAGSDEGANGARIDDSAGTDISPGSYDAAGAYADAQQQRGWAGLGYQAGGYDAGGFWDRNQDSGDPEEDLGDAEDLRHQLEDTGGAYWHWPLT